MAKPPHLDTRFCASGSAPRGLYLVGHIAAMLVMTACEREGISEHTIEKGIERIPAAEAPEPPGSGPAPAGPETGRSQTERPWTVPDGWSEDPEPRRMRLTTYVAPSPGGPVEVAVSRFPGRVGGELANVNRWRRQMGLGPVSESELESTLTRFDAEGFDGYETRIESGAGVMLAAGIYQAGIDQTWFVRATAPNAESADHLEPAMSAFARSIAQPENRGDD